MTPNIWIYYKDHDSRFDYDKMWIKHNTDHSIERIRIVQYGHEGEFLYTVFYVKLIKTTDIIDNEQTCIEDNSSISYVASLDEIFYKYDIDNNIFNDEVINNINDLYD